MKIFYQFLVLLALTSVCSFAAGAGNPFVAVANEAYVSATQIAVLAASTVIIFLILSSGFSGARIIASIGIGLVVAYVLTHASQLVYYVQSIV